MARTLAEGLHPSRADRDLYGPSMSVKEAAWLTGRSESTVRERCKDGTIKAVRFGRCWVINTDALFNQLGY